MMKKKSRLEESIEVTKNAEIVEWCRVDIDNNFSFNYINFNIDKSVEEYKVYKKAGEIEEYTNEAYMEEILVVLKNSNDLSFYDQNYKKIENKNISVL